MVDTTHPLPSSTMMIHGALFPAYYGVVGRILPFRRVGSLAMVPGEVAMARFGEIPSLTSYFLRICTADAYFFAAP